MVSNELTVETSGAFRLIHSDGCHSETEVGLLLSLLTVISAQLVELRPPDYWACTHRSQCLQVCVAPRSAASSSFLGYQASGLSLVPAMAQCYPRLRIHSVPGYLELRPSPLRSQALGHLSFCRRSSTSGALC